MRGICGSDTPTTPSYFLEVRGRYRNFSCHEGPFIRHAGEGEVGHLVSKTEGSGYGFEFPPIGERMDRLEEALTICRLMFTEERPSFEGKHYRIERALNSPRPIQAGGPQILIGGTGERRTLRSAARHADITHWFGSLEVLKHKLEVFEKHCEARGRHPQTLHRRWFQRVHL
jgi:alkanesulfonate monooxygenase SsuD/methylene tetrahydromethanopterin reductase-like flavin-dependent oxidoreductase (luciferase family)